MRCRRLHVEHALAWGDLQGVGTGGGRRRRNGVGASLVVGEALGQPPHAHPRDRCRAIGHHDGARQGHERSHGHRYGGIRCRGAERHACGPLRLGRMRADEDVVALDHRVVDNGEGHGAVRARDGRVGRAQGAAPDLASAASDGGGFECAGEGPVGLGVPPVGRLAGDGVVHALGDPHARDRLAGGGVDDADSDVAQGRQGQVYRGIGVGQGHPTAGLESDRHEGRGRARTLRGRRLHVEHALAGGGLQRVFAVFVGADDHGVRTGRIPGQALGQPAHAHARDGRRSIGHEDLAVDEGQVARPGDVHVGHGPRALRLLGQAADAEAVEGRLGQSHDRVARQAGTDVGEVLEGACAPGRADRHLDLLLVLTR